MTIKISAALLMIAFAICLDDAPDRPCFDLEHGSAGIAGVDDINDCHGRTHLADAAALFDHFCQHQLALGACLAVCVQPPCQGYAGLRIGVLDGLEMDQNRRCMSCFSGQAGAACARRA